MILKMVLWLDLICELQNLTPMLCCLIHHVFVGLTKFYTMKDESVHFHKK